MTYTCCSLTQSTTIGSSVLGAAVVMARASSRFNFAIVSSASRIVVVSLSESNQIIYSATLATATLGFTSSAETTFYISENTATAFTLAVFRL